MKAAALLAAALVAGAVAAAAPPSKTFDRTEALPATGSVTLETHNGTVDIRTWDRPQIEIHAVIEAPDGTTLDTRRLEGTTVDVRTSGDSVWIASRYPTESWYSWFGGNPVIHYTITAPHTARWTLRDHNARVDIKDVRAAVRVETHNGSVHLTGLDGPLEVEAHNGEVTADLVSFHGADLTSHNGSVELALPSTAAFRLHADTWRGAVQSDFPVAVNAWGPRRSRNLDAAVGAGGPTLRFSTHGGRLRLVSKKAAG